MNTRLLTPAAIITVLLTLLAIVTTAQTINKPADPTLARLHAELDWSGTGDPTPQYVVNMQQGILDALDKLKAAGPCQ